MQKNKLTTYSSQTLFFWSSIIEAYHFRQLRTHCYITSCCQG